MLAFYFMDFVTACKYAILGYRIRRENWDGGYAQGTHKFDKLRDGYGDELTLDDFLADDWELITEGIVKYFPITYSD